MNAKSLPLYYTLQKDIDKEVAELEKQRYARFQDRLDTADMSADMVLKTAHGEFYTTYSVVKRPLRAHFPPKLQLLINWFMLLAVHYRVMEHVGSLESTKKA